MTRGSEQAPLGKECIFSDLSGVARKVVRNTLNRCFSSSKRSSLITLCNTPVKQGLAPHCPESERKRVWKEEKPVCDLRVGSAPEGLLWLGSEHSCWILDLVLCASPYRQSRGRKRKLVGPTGLAERFSWALHQEEAASPRTQHDPLTLLGELFPAIPKDNKSSTRNLLAEQEEKQFHYKCPSEQISFGEDWMKLRRVKLF